MRLPTNNIAHPSTVLLIKRRRKNRFAQRRRVSPPHQVGDIPLHPVAQLNAGNKSRRPAQVYHENHEQEESSGDDEEGHGDGHGHRGGGSPVARTNPLYHKRV